MHELITFWKWFFFRSVILMKLQPECIIRSKCQWMDCCQMHGFISWPTLSDQSVRHFESWAHKVVSSRAEMPGCSVAAPGRMWERLDERFPCSARVELPGDGWRAKSVIRCKCVERVPVSLSRMCGQGAAPVICPWNTNGGKECKVSLATVTDAVNVRFFRRDTLMCVWFVCRYTYLCQWECQYS